MSHLDMPLAPFPWRYKALVLIVFALVLWGML